MKYKLLEDLPISQETKERKLSFGHKSLARILMELIIKCPSPYTIGLYGKWGTGKTSLILILKQLFSEKSIPVLIFDVWKHEGEGLKRSFLAEIERQLKNLGDEYLDKEFQLDDRVTKEYKETIKGELKIDKTLLKKIWKSCSKYLYISIAALFIIFIVLGIFYPQGLKTFANILSQILVIVTSLGLGTALIGWLFKRIAKFTTTNDINYTYERFKDPIEFEKEFNRILENIRKERVLIVFDNLDRVTGENAVSIISSIKTFLEPSGLANKDINISFLIPCDIDAIKRHLVKVYQDEPNYQHDAKGTAEEFLRKFFNTQIWIPEFYEIEIEKFTFEKLVETEIPEFKDELLAWFIAKIFHDNPRQIIQFINVLISNYVLMCERSQEGIDVQFVQENVPQLAKFLMMMQRYPGVMEAFKKNRIYYLQTLDGDEIKNWRINELEAVQYHSFLNETSDVYIDSLELFFTHRLTEQEQNIPGSAHLMKLVQNDIPDEYLQEAKSLINQQNLNDFNDIIRKYLLQIHNAIRIMKFINAILNISYQLKIKLNTKNFKEFEKRINIYSEHINEIYPDLIYRQFFANYSEISKKSKQSISQQFVNKVIKHADDKDKFKLSDEYKYRLIKCFKEFSDTIFQKDIESLKSTLAESFSKDLEIATIFIDDIVTQETFLSKGFIENFIESIENKDITNDTDVTSRLNLVKNVGQKLVTNEVSQILIQKFTELLTVENARPIEGRLTEREQQLSVITEIFHNKISSKAESCEPAVLQNFFTQINEGFNKTRWAGSHFYMPMVFEIEEYGPANLEVSSRNIVKTFFTSGPHTSIIWLKDHLSADRDIESDEEILKILDTRIQADQNILNELYGYFSNEIQIRWILLLLNNIPDPERFLSFVEELNFKIPGKVEIGNALLTKVKTVPDADKKARLYKTLEGLKIAKTKLNLQEFKAQTSSLLKSLDQNIQRIGLNVLKDTKYLNKSEKRILSEECFDFVKNQTAYYPHLINAINISYDEMNQDRQSEFQQFLLHDIIYKSNDPSAISHASGLIGKMHLSFQRRRTNLEELKARIESETNLRTVLIESLKVILQSFRQTEKIKKYRNWIDSFDKE